MFCDEDFEEPAEDGRTTYLVVGPPRFLRQSVPDGCSRRLGSHGWTNWSPGLASPDLPPNAHLPCWKSRATPLAAVRGGSWHPKRWRK